jgi:hypothetical protein
MQRNRIFFLSILLILSIFVFSCSKENNPVTTQPDSSVLLNTSFEKNGIPDDEGWTISASPLGDIVTDAPRDGGTYCLKLEASNPGGMAFIKVPAKTDKKVYNFTFWGKTTQPSSSAYFDLIRNGQIQSRVELSVMDTTWTKYSLVDTLQVMSGDSIRIIFQERLNQLLMIESYFDLVKVETVD